MVFYQIVYRDIQNNMKDGTIPIHSEIYKRGRVK